MHISRALFPGRSLSTFGKNTIAALLCTAAVFGASGRAACQGNTNGEPLPIPVFTVTDFAKPFPAAFLSNGFIGIRPGANPLKTSSSAEWVESVTMADWTGKGRPISDHPLATIVGGFVWNKYFGAEGMAPAPYPLATDLLVDGVSMLEHPEMVAIHRQSLDLNNGELTTEMSFNPASGREINISVVQFASRSVPTLLCQQITLQSSTIDHVEIRTKIDTTGTLLNTYAQAAPYGEDDTDRVMGFATDRAKLGIALVVPKADNVERQEVGKYVAHLKSGRSVAFVTFASMVSDFYASDPEISAMYTARWGEMLGFEKLRQQNRDIWSDLWKGRIKVYGDAGAQRALDTAFFYLMSNTHPSSLTGTPPFGFSQFEAYGGHIAGWDMDMWMLPPLMLLAPETAKAMLEFRARGLGAAQKHARIFGYQGAMYPWESGVHGDEVGPSDSTPIWAEQHITPDIGIAFWEYQQATGDDEFLRRASWPVLRNIADWIASRGTFTERGFEIRNVMGIDEDEALAQVDNNSFTNVACQMAMRAAIAAAAKVGAEAPAKWRQVADSMVIPTDAKTGVVLPYDGAVPGPKYSLYTLPMLFLHNLPVPADQYRKTFLYDEELSKTLPVTSSVFCTKEAVAFSCLPVAASQAYVGDRHSAAESFRHSYEWFRVEPFGLSKEYPKYTDGNYATNDASLLMSALFGFTGIRIAESDWHLYPAALPEGWQRIEIDRIWIKGKPMKLVAENGKPAQITDSK